MRIWIVSAAIVTALVLGGWAFYFEPAGLEVHHYGLDLPGWPASQDGLSIALLSDLHVGSPYYGLEQLRHVVRAVNEERPDVVLLAGDYVIDGVWGGTFTPPKASATVLASLEAPLGVYAVLGNHDWWYDGPRVRRALEAAGIVCLDNRSLRVEGGRFSFRLVGLGDLWEDRPDMAAIVAALPEDGLPRLAFTHNPDVFPEVPAEVGLTLAGHTHGGQALFPFFGRPVVPSKFGQRYAAGHIVEDGRHLFVTTGLGTSLLPVRFRVPPEIAILRLFAWSADTDG